MEQELSYWGIFIALQGRIEIFAECAKSGRLLLTVYVDQGAVVD